MQAYKCGNCGCINFQDRRCKNCGKGNAYLGRIAERHNYKGWFNTDNGEQRVEDEIVVLKEFDNSAVVMFTMPLPRTKYNQPLCMHDFLLSENIWVERHSELLDYIDEVTLDSFNIKEV